jgi:hypothetical protein
MSIRSASRFTLPLLDVIVFYGEASSVTVTSQMAMRNRLANVNYSMRGAKDTLRMEQAASHSHCSIDLSDDLSALLGIEFLMNEESRWK